MGCLQRSSPIRGSLPWYSSEHSGWPGVGYPSCSRSLARIPRNLKDPNGYYAELGLLPWATQDEIKSALRDVYKRYHPDGLTPNPEKFMRFQEIGSVLTDPELKLCYDRTPDGQLFIDSQILSVIADSGINIEDVSPPRQDEPEESERFYDYYSEGEDPFDMWNAQKWYEAILSVAPLISYTKSIRLFITDDGNPLVLLNAGIVQIPRGWEPSSALAFGIMTQCVVA